MSLFLILLTLLPPCELLNDISACTLLTCTPDNYYMSHKTMQKSTQKPSDYKQGDFLLGGIVQLGLLNNGPNRFCKNANSRLIRHIMAMIYAIEEINNNPNLLPNISLGYQIEDSCANTLIAQQGTLAIFSKRTEPVPNYSCQRKDTLIGFIGDLSSATSDVIAQLIGLYKYPQISFGALDPVFSDKLIYPSFYRTAPSELSQYTGIAQLLKYFHWSWVGILASDDDRGERALRELKKEITLTGACIAFSHIIPTLLTRVTNTQMNRFLEVMKTSTAQVVILYSRGTAEFLNYAYYYRPDLPTMIWVSSVSMLFIKEMPFGEVLRALNGTLAFSLRSREITGFKDFLYDVNPAVLPGAFSLHLLWVNTFGCKVKESKHFETTDFEGLPFCSGNETFRNHRLADYDVSNFRFSYTIYGAVYSLAYALNAMLSSGTALGADMDTGSLKKDMMPWKLNRYLRNLHVKTPNGAEFSFDERGDVVPEYDILNWVYLPNGTIIDFPVGQLDPLAPEGHQLLINESSILWPPPWSNNKEIPRAVCSESCRPGYRKAQIEGKPICCFVCVPCGEGEFSHSSDAENCLSCPEDQLPNKNKDACIQKDIVFLSYSDAVGLGLALIGILFALATTGVLIIFLRHRDTPIVKANNRTISYALLICLMLAFLCSLLFIGRPEKWTCLIQQAAFGVIFTAAVSCVLAKTITVVIAFNAIRPGSSLSRWLGPRVSGTMVLLCTLGQALICLSWLLTAPPHPLTDMVSETGKLILLCDQGSVTGFFVVIGYMGLLAFASFIVAFLARNLPDRFNEAQLITFSMLVFCSVWVSFIPAYLSTKGRYMVIVEVTAILASSAGLLGCIFIPKCYIILLRPEINNKECIAVRDNVQK